MARFITNFVYVKELHIFYRYSSSNNFPNMITNTSLLEKFLTNCRLLHAGWDIGTSNLLEKEDERT